MLWDGLLIKSLNLSILIHSVPLLIQTITEYKFLTFFVIPAFAGMTTHVNVMLVL